MWNEVASLQYAAGLLPVSGAGYALGTVIPDLAALVKTREALEAQATAIGAYYRGACPQGWPVQLASLCVRTTAAAGALGAGPVPMLFVGGSADAVIPPQTQVQAAAASAYYNLLQKQGAGHVSPACRRMHRPECARGAGGVGRGRHWSKPPRQTRRPPRQAHPSSLGILPTPHSPQGVIYNLGTTDVTVFRSFLDNAEALPSTPGSPTSSGFSISPLGNLAGLAAALAAALLLN